MNQTAAATTTTKTKRAQGATSRSESMEKQIMGVPARIMRPRLILIAVTAFLVFLGFVMIFSASSVEAISENGDAAYYLKRQIAFAAIGLGLAVLATHWDYHTLSDCLLFFWVITLLMLVAVWLFGKETNGASRWIQIGFFRLQPSEFAKATLVLAAANICHRFYATREISVFRLMGEVVVFLGIPVLLIALQPDNGTVGIIVVMFFAVLYYSGFPRDYLVKFIFFMAVLAAIAVLAMPYARQRVITMLDPSSDPYGTGWQLNQGFIAFGSGGLFGVGVGMSRQKYSYLPEAHNDFIFAIIGEELGLVGTLIVLAAFFLLVYEAIKIARQAPDLLGRLLVIGSTTLLVTQFFLNAMGVLGMFPLSGKPMPFLSYGGSSIMSCLILIGLIVNVSMRSTLPETAHDQRRRSMSLVDKEDTGVSEPRVRGRASRTSASAGESLPLARLDDGRSSGSGAKGSSRSLSVVEGGRSQEGRNSSKESSVARGTSSRGRAGAKKPSGGYERIDLNKDSASRLRSNSGPTVRGTNSSSSNKNTMHTTKATSTRLGRRGK